MSRPSLTRRAALAAVAGLWLLSAAGCCCDLLVYIPIDEGGLARAEGGRARQVRPAVPTHGALRLQAGSFGDLEQGELAGPE